MKSLGELSIQTQTNSCQFPIQISYKPYQSCKFLTPSKSFKNPLLVLGPDYSPVMTLRWSSFPLVNPPPYCVQLNHIQCQSLGKTSAYPNWRSSFRDILLGSCFPFPFFPEPVGSIGPRLTSGDESRILRVYLAASATLLCPAQAYPVPFFR